MLGKLRNDASDRRQILDEGYRKRVDRLIAWMNSPNCFHHSPRLNAKGGILLAYSIRGTMDNQRLSCKYIPLTLLRSPFTEKEIVLKMYINKVENTNFVMMPNLAAEYQNINSLSSKIIHEWQLFTMRQDSAFIKYLNRQEDTNQRNENIFLF
ncbi:hypothetical protein EGR_10395 [Echinococcus granulosus]|uniref:Uncharacterized protein n=1 Tax=Echinococcus granulosus TaxID=6210 RepID=W6U0W2_ECHGR|nr:hypothetical protein EGR_10395 [Echinococcus granulosus]EUB54755.1 hypothetical protein EGR_10395 [Echinococcus granulosus]